MNTRERFEKTDHLVNTAVSAYQKIADIGQLIVALTEGIKGLKNEAPNELRAIQEEADAFAVDLCGNNADLLETLANLLGNLRSLRDNFYDDMIHTPVHALTSPVAPKDQVAEFRRILEDMPSL